MYTDTINVNPMRQLTPHIGEVSLPVSRPYTKADIERISKIIRENRELSDEVAR